MSDSVSYSDESELDDLINVKDFAYTDSDPKHFGIYNSDEEEEEYEEEGFENKYNYTDDDNEKYSESYEERSFNIGITTNTVEIDEINQVPHDNIRYNNETDINDNKVTAEDLLHAVALYPFVPENSNELALEIDQVLIINYECGDGWLVAHDPITGETGLVPSEYIRILNNEETIQKDPLLEVEEEEEGEEEENNNGKDKGILFDYEGEGTIDRSEEKSDIITKGEFDGIETKLETEEVEAAHRFMPSFLENPVSNNA